MTCTAIPTPARNLAITFPGGATIGAVTVGIGPPTQLELAQAMMVGAGPVLAGLQPVFNIIDALKAIMDLAIAIPSVVVAPDDVIKATAHLATAIDRLVHVIPQLSVPLMIIGIIDTVLAALLGIVVELEALERQLARVTSAETLAGTLTGGAATALLSATSCSRTNVAAQMTNLTNGLGPINQLLTVATSLAKLAGLPALGSLDDLGTDPTPAKEALNTVAATLHIIRASIPL